MNDMATSTLVSGYDGYVDLRRATLRARMETLRVALKGWAKSEHRWQNRTGDLEKSIDAIFVTGEGDAESVYRLRLQAAMEPAVWLEMFHEGRWAWLAKVFETHKDDIQAILAGAITSEAIYTADPDARAEADAYHESTKKKS